jgi:hypothetical protein
MLKIPDNQQFKEIEEKLGTTLTVPSKIQFKIWEYPEVIEMIKQEAECRGLTTQNFVRWVVLKQLSNIGRLKIHIEPYKDLKVTFEDLEFKDEHEMNIAERRLNYRKRGDAMVS